jgi:hypothetical protein
MGKDIHSDLVLKQYLLDELSGADCDQIEREYLADRDFFDQLLAVEDDLVDDYVAGELNPHARDRFERKMLATPRQREKLSQARLLLGSDRVQSRALLQERNHPLSKIAAWADALSQRRILAFATLLLLVSAGWLAIRVWQVNGQLEQMQADRVRAVEEHRQLQAKLSDQQKQNTELLQKLHPVPDTPGPVEPPKSESGPHLATLILPLTGTRGGGEQGSFKINQETQTVQLVAHITNSDYRSFNGELQNADGKQLFTFRRLKARKTANGNALLVSVPTKLFEGSDFVLKVSGVTDDGHLEDAGFYSFRITRN